MSIDVKNLTYIYMPKTPFEKKALDDVSLTINNNDFAAIIGHTGSGKSTLIQHFNGLLKPTSGKVIIDGKNIFDSDVKLSDIRKKVGLVFQYPEYQLFEETIEKDIAFGPSKMGLNQEEIKIRVKKAMQVVGLSYETYKDVSPFDLSGGQKRRAAIAGILAMEPKILILDEPTAGLDPKGRDEILAQIKKFHTEYNMTIILVSHSMEDVAKVANNIFVMSKGKCILRGEPKKVFKEIDILEETGLAAPAVTYLAKELKNRGLDISDEIFTVRQAAESIFKMIDQKRNSLRRELE
jgi:energy-coupling factor transport system ATP-binding protein